MINPFILDHDNKLVGLLDTGNRYNALSSTYEVCVFEFSHGYDEIEKELAMHVYLDSDAKINGDGTKTNPFNTPFFTLRECEIDNIDKHCLNLVVHVRGAWKETLLNIKNETDSYYEITYNVPDDVHIFITNWNDTNDGTYWKFEIPEFCNGKSFSRSQLYGVKYVEETIILKNGVNGIKGTDGDDGRNYSEDGHGGGAGSDGSSSDTIIYNNKEISLTQFTSCGSVGSAYYGRISITVGRPGLGGMGGNGGNGADGAPATADHVLTTGDGGDGARCGKWGASGAPIDMPRWYYGYVNCELNVDVVVSFTSVDFSQGGGRGGNGGNGVYRESRYHNYWEWDCNSGNGGDGVVAAGRAGTALFDNTRTPRQGKLICSDYTDIYTPVYNYVDLPDIHTSIVNFKLLFDDFDLDYTMYPCKSGALNYIGGNSGDGEGLSLSLKAYYDIRRLFNSSYNSKINVAYIGKFSYKVSAGDAGNGGDDTDGAGSSYAGYGGGISCGADIRSPNYHTCRLYNSELYIDFSQFGINVLMETGDAGNAGRSDYPLRSGGRVEALSRAYLPYIKVSGYDSKITVTDEDFYNINVKVPNIGGLNSDGVTRATVEYTESYKCGILLDSVNNITTNGTVIS